MKSNNSVAIFINISFKDRLLINIYEIMEFCWGFPNNILNKRLFAHPSLCMFSQWNSEHGIGFVLIVHQIYPLF